MARIVLVGLPGVGKTSVALALADRWDCESIDTDDLIAAAVGMKAPDYLRTHGEPAFRQREIEALERAVARDAVIATGGGVVTTPEGRAVLAEQCTLWLDCDDEAILVRIGAQDRPLLAGDHAGSLARLRQERADWYLEVARARIDGADSIDVVTQRVIDEMEQVDS
jgi:shikimate kinase